MITSMTDLELELRNTRFDLLIAYQQLNYLWQSTGSCPCGARKESPRAHPHVSTCPTAKAAEMFQEDDTQPAPLDYAKTSLSD